MIATWTLLVATASLPPSAEQYYATAVDKMRSEPPIPNVAYAVDIKTSGARFYAERSKSGKVMVAWGIGSKRESQPSMNAAYREADQLTALQTPQGRGTTRVPIFDPTWNGIYAWMRYGLEGPPDSVGAARCSNGDEGHALHLVARRDPQAHPLTDAVVDVQTGGFCEMRFGFRQSGPLSATGVMDLNLNRVGGHITSQVDYRGFTFPATLPEAYFTP